MTQKLAAQTIGFLPISVQVGNGTFQINSAIKAAGYARVMTETKTLNEFRAYCSTNGGNLALIAMDCDVYDDVNGVPGSVLATASIAAGAFVAGFNDFTGFNISLTAGGRYWFILKNKSADPVTNNPTFRTQAGQVAPVHAGFRAGNIAGPSTTWGEAWATTPDYTAGTPTWTVSHGAVGYRLKFSDGSYAGFPSSSLSSNAGSIYGANFRGVVVTTPAHAKLKVSGVTMPILQTGPPTGNLVFKLYNGLTLLGTSSIVKPGNVAITYPWYVSGYFSTPIEVAPGTMLRAVACDSAADDGTHCYQHPEFTIDDTAASKALMPWGAKRTVSTDSGASFTDTDTVMVPFGLILDTDGEFAPAGGLITHPGMSGGMNG